MAKSKVQEIKWLPDAEPHNYPAAESYLRLLFDPKVVAKLVQRLKKIPVDRFRAKDIFRASQLSLLGVSNSHVAKGQMKIQTGQGLSPLLLVRNEAHGRLVIADGYHRLCAIYGFDEDAWIHCKIVGTTPD